MMISTKGRYALRVMIDLAQNDGESFVSLKDVAERQGISMKYLEMIVSLLHKGHMVKSQRGKAFSRMYLYVHFPTDILGGAVLGITIGALTYVYGTKILKIKKE